MANFFTLRTVKWSNGSVLLIDQSRLPNKFRYVKCRSCTEVARAIKDMVVRGAPAIGVAGAMGLALAAQRSKGKTREALMRELEAAAKTLRETRPTGMNLFWAIRRVLETAKATPGGVEDVVRAVVGEAGKMAEEDVAANMMIGFHGAHLIADGDVVLTHCKWV